jgi:hypothetical protein
MAEMDLCQMRRNKFIELRVSIHGVEKFVVLIPGFAAEVGERF